jgi:hypothetical protein
VVELCQYPDGRKCPDEDCEMTFPGGAAEERDLAYLLHFGQKHLKCHVEDKIFATEAEFQYFMREDSRKHNRAIKTSDTVVYPLHLYRILCKSARIKLKCCNATKADIGLYVYWYMRNILRRSGSRVYAYYCPLCAERITACCEFQLEYNRFYHLSEHVRIIKP